MRRANFPIGFPLKHPVFGPTERRKGIAWNQSAYYFWWDFLKLHEGYAETCRKGGKGAYATLYADFGNVHDIEFKDWWTGKVGDETRGAYLFGEPPAPTTVKALSKDEVLQLFEKGGDSQVLLVSIPLNYSRREISKRLGQVIRDNHGRKRGEKRLSISKARYVPLSIPDIDSLEKARDIYMLRRDNPQMRLWQLACGAGLGTRSTYSMAKTDSDARAALTAAASRKLRHAELIIDGVGKGLFPVPLPTKRRDKASET